MHLRILALCVSLVFAPAAIARTVAAGDPASLADRAEVHAASVTDAAAFLAEVDGNLQLARDGQYGRLKRGDMRRLESARDRIHALLAGHGSALELAPADRIALYNAQESIRSVLRSDDKNRTVCLREATTGSRIPTTECMTVAEREERARVARQSINRMVRDICFISSSANPAEAHDCAK